MWFSRFITSQFVARAALALCLAFAACGDSSSSSADGTDGVDGTDGADGSDGADGTDGTGCTPGDTGCACADGDTCSDASDACTEGVCAPRTDCSGELGCPCDGGSCDEGLSCENDVCVASNSQVVTLSGGDARACDLVIMTNGRKVSEVTFPAGVRGRFKTRNEKTSVALIRTNDTALSGSVAAVTFDGDDAASGEIQTVTATCYDRLGAADSGVTAAAQ